MGKDQPGLARPTQRGVPATKRDRDHLLGEVRRYVAAARPVPPLSYNELYGHTKAVLQSLGDGKAWRNWLTVVINNETWRERLAQVPYDRRLLLLPQCLRDPGECPAAIDELGLVCRSCGRCPTGEIKAEAERLGYAVLITEGTAVVSALIRTGRIDAIVGISCMESLAKVFVMMEAAAIPAIAIPLLYDGCSETAVDMDWVWDAVRLSSREGVGWLDLDALRRQVDAWFAPAGLDTLLGPTRDPTKEVARGWLALSGKRWRPFLVAGAYQALAGAAGAPVPKAVQQVALAVECFHKASLVHDDIEDDDAVRYGEKTLHERYGVPLALNVGDFLIGEGYDLIARAEVSDRQKAEMLVTASGGHRRLCLGQGRELAWARDPRPLGPAEVLGIFRDKTAPAFAVALRLGAACADADAGVGDALDRYAEALGIAYQIRDDLDDFLGSGARSDAHSARPSILLALAYERARGEDRDLLESLWRRLPPSQDLPERIGRILEALEVEEAAIALMNRYKGEAVAALEALTSADLKGLLRRVVGKIFDGLGERIAIHDLEPQAAGDDLEVGDARGRAIGAEPAA